MASTELRRLVIDPTIDPQIARIGTVVNRLIDMSNGNGTGRMWLIGDDGNKKATFGSSAVPSGTVLSANNYPLRVEPTSTNQVNVFHSNGSTIGLRVQDGGLTSGVPASLTSTLTVTGATILQSTLAVTGVTTLTGALLANGAVTLGDAAADVITITGTATVAEILTLTKGLVVDTNTLVVDAVNNRVGVLTATPQSGLEVASVIYATQTAAYPTTGAGVHMVYDTGIGYVYAYNNTGAVHTPLILQGLSVSLLDATLERIKVDATGIGVFAHATATQQSVAGAASDLTSVISLANSLRTGLRAYGWFS
jgi:hypothetical protein